MKCTLVCSCGLLLETSGEKLLIDGVTVNFPPFFPLPERDFSLLLEGKSPYYSVKTLVFTHLHPDHYSSVGVKQVCAAQPDVRVRIPDGGDFETDVFSVCFHPITHTPVPPHLMVPHYALLVSANGKTVYVTADAEPDAQKHRAILAGHKVDAAFWNSQHLSYPEMRKVMAECVGQNYIYHLPADDADKTGIRRKCRSNLERFANELQNVTALEHYPSEIEI